jgi:glycosyltransferase involved in cell wall biosynthesis
LRIALLSKSFLPNVGGIETSTAMIAEVWQGGGHDVEVITATADATPWSGPYRVSRDWSLRALTAKTAETDLVASNGYSRVAIAAAGRHGRPIVIFHQGYQLICSDGLGFRNRKFHHFRMAADLRLAVAAGVRSTVHALARIPVDGLVRAWRHGVTHVVPSRHVAARLDLPDSTVLYQPPNPIVIAAIDALGPQPADMRARAHQAGDIVFFGRLVFEKGCDVLVRSYARWLGRGCPGIGAGRAQPRLVLYGRGPELGRIEALIGELGVAGAVDLRPFLGGQELVEAARAASVVVIPSVWEEPGATIAVELYACGVPVIASATGAQGEIFSGQGLLVPNGDVEALAEAFVEHFSAGPFAPRTTGTEPWSLPTIKRTLLSLVVREP